MSKEVEEDEEEEEKKSFKSVINKKDLGKFEMDLLFFDEKLEELGESEEEDLE